MRPRTLALAVLAACTALAPIAAMAHTGVGATGGFAHGFWHPIGGLDHVLAMVLVGMLAWQLGGRALWLVPSAFVAVMAVGGALGIAGVALPMVEFGIALSIVVLGAAVALGLRAPVAVAMAVTGLFALTYGVGFMLATSALHVCGIGLGLAVGAIGDRSGLAIRSAGGLAAIVGLAFLTGAL
jgi:urease accessory protein